MLDAVGPAKAIAALQQPTAATARTVAEQIEHHIDHLTGVEAGTISDYRGYLHRDIAPHVGTLPLPLFKRDDVADWVNKMDRDRGLSAKSIRNRHSLISAAMRSAVRDELIVVNPAEGVRMPSRDHEAEEMVTLTLREVWDFTQATKEHWRPMVLFLFGTGVRFGEASALRVKDVNLEAGHARIRQAWKHTDGNGHRLGTTKSKRSTRTIVFGRDVAAAIRPLVEGRAAEDFVFTNTRGGVVRHSNFHEDVWQNALHVFAGDTLVKTPTKGRPKLSWLPGPGKRPRPHDARHTYASLQISRGMSMAFLQRQLGHENINTTISTYTHLQTADLAVLSDVIDRPLELEP